MQLDKENIAPNNSLSAKNTKGVSVEGINDLKVL